MHGCSPSDFGLLYFYTQWFKLSELEKRLSAKFNVNLWKIWWKFKDRHAARRILSPPIAVGYFHCAYFSTWHSLESSVRYLHSPSFAIPQLSPTRTYAIISIFYSAAHAATALNLWSFDSFTQVHIDLDFESPHWSALVWIWAPCKAPQYQRIDSRG